MENLLPEIKLDIFSRLPAESVLQCKQVCKTWRTLLHHPYFAHMHLHRSLQFGNVGLLYFTGEYDDFYKKLYYGEYDENDEQSYKTLKRINHPYVNMRDNVIGSCNGLICFSVCHDYDIYDPVYICNPLTREYVDLPRYDINTIVDEKCLMCPMVSGFGYVPSTNEYKVVRIFYCWDHDQPQPSAWVGNVQVYTLGGGNGWRNKGKILYSLSWWTLFANGALHWLDKEEMKIVAFDLADEEFCLLPSPPCFVPSEDNFFRLRVLGGLLCFVHEKRGVCVDIWSFKEKNRSTTYDMKEQEFQSWSWHKEFSIAWEGLVTREYEIFAFTKSGEVLLWCNKSILFLDNHNHSILSRYDPKTAASKNFDSDMRFLEAIPHINSFVSLKALGEDDAKIVESIEDLLEFERLQPNWGVENSYSAL